ncbi:hypothetical protein ACIGHG_21470 [Bacillus sp. NPDC077411]|uniref:hypothetical protein n=1 Tax=Bacillus sp. NPDC077411 TaxID=3363947 RepID=UPI0037C4FD53
MPIVISLDVVAKMVRTLFKKSSLLRLLVEEKEVVGLKASQEAAKERVEELKATLSKSKLPTASSAAVDSKTGKPFPRCRNYKITIDGAHVTSD